MAVVDVKTGREYVRLTGNNSNLLEPVLVDCSSFLKKPVKVKVADQSEQPWGHINFGGIYEHTPDKDK